MKSIFLIWLILNLELYFKNILTEKSTLKLINVLFRHGDRTPTNIYKNDPYQFWPEGSGQLTNIGKKQMYVLGLSLKEHYKDFLPEYYFPSNINVMSSYADRCIMSAQIVLAALFPSTKDQIWNPDILWQSIPVHYVERHMDNMIALKRKCHWYDIALQNAYKSERIQNLDDTNKELYEYLSKHTGDQINNISKVETLYNTFEIELLHNLTLPDWTNNISMETLKNLSAQNLAIYSDNLLMKRLSGGVLLKQIITDMKQKKENTTDLDIILYSGHDLTIVTFLRTLGFDKLLKPDYGASVILEIHHVSNLKYEVKLLYSPSFSSQLKYLHMKFCPIPCLLEDFIKGLQDVIPHNWEEECDVSYNV